jgi:hypothetical protein
VGGDQFRPVGVRARLPGHRCLLALEVAQVAGGGQPGHEPVGVGGQFSARLVAIDNLVVGDEQHEQHGGVPGQR